VCKERKMVVFLSVFEFHLLSGEDIFVFLVLLLVRGVCNAVYMNSLCLEFNIGFSDVH